MSDTDLIRMVAWTTIVLFPVLLYFTWKQWRLHAKSRKYDERKPKPRIRLSLILAFTSSLAVLGDGILAAASYFFVTGRIDLAQRLGGATLLVYVILLLIPLINSAYLSWLDRKGGVA